MSAAHPHGTPARRLLVRAALVLGLLAAGALPARAGDFAWLDSLEAARAQARAAGKPVLAVFRCTP